VVKSVPIVLTLLLACGTLAACGSSVDAAEPTATSAALPATAQASIWPIDTMCIELIETPVDVRADYTATNLVDRFLTEAWSESSFEIVRHDVTATGGVAKVAMYHRGDSVRIVQSLSSCENLALLGGIRKTLVNDGELGIDTVQFTGDATGIEG